MDGIKRTQEFCIALFITITIGLIALSITRDGGVQLNQSVTPLLVALITQVVIVILFLVLHFVVDPRKEHKKFQREQLNFYGKLYANLSARGSFIIKHRTTLNLLPDVQTYGETESMPEHLTRQGLEKLIFDNAAFATTELLQAWTDYVSGVGKKVEQDSIDKLSREIVVQYNLLRKELKLDYNQEELTSGVPKIYHFLLK